MPTNSTTPVVNATTRKPKSVWLFQIVCTVMCILFFVGIVRSILWVNSNQDAWQWNNQIIIEFSWRVLATAFLFIALIGTQRRAAYGRYLGLLLLALLFCYTVAMYSNLLATGLPWKPAYNNPSVGKFGEFLGALIVTNLVGYWFYAFGFSKVAHEYFNQLKNINEVQCKVAFDANGKILSIEVLQGQWAIRQDGQNKYQRQKANSLLQAVEILKKIDHIPQLTYYIVDTPDGSLGRDINGYYTEAPIKTENLIVESRCDKSEAVEFSSLKGFGDMLANHTTVAHLKKIGEYSRLVLLMKCGHCGYESPVETQEGSLIRECYCCGVKNKGNRGEINIFLSGSTVEI